MFGMGFTEILLIAVVAILFLGPDKLPDAMVQIAKFFRSAKQTLAAAKDSLDEEVNISELKEEALNYQKKLTSAKADIESIASGQIIKDEIASVAKDVTGIASPYADAERPSVTFPKKSSEESEESEEDVEKKPAKKKKKKVAKVEQKEQEDV